MFARREERAPARDGQDPAGQAIVRTNRPYFSDARHRGRGASLLLQGARSDKFPALRMPVPARLR